MAEREELTTREAAKAANVTDSYIRRLLIEGTLKGRKLNKWMWLVDRASLEKWNAQRKR